MAAKKGMVPTAVETNILQGSRINKIVELGLSERANELRSAGYSLSEICSLLNDKYLATSEHKLSIMSLQRFFNRWSEIDKIDNRIKDEEALNFLNEYRLLYDLAIDSVEAVGQSIAIDRKAKDTKNTRDNSFLLEKLMARCQNLLQSMADMVGKINTYVNLNRIIVIMFEIITDECGIEVVAKIKNRMKGHKELHEMMKKMKDTKVV
jgi:hypothetical protein